VTDGGVQIVGGDELAASLHRASDQLDDMARAGEQSGNLILNRARVAAPRLTGALASSLTLTTERLETAVTSGLPYAARTHYGYPRYDQRAQPFLTDARDQTQNVWIEYYADEAERVLHTVKGA
jgi:hypothetical protein